jgi:hypothetical protein
MKFQGLLFGVIALGLFATCCVTFMNSLNDNYSAYIDMSSLEGVNASLQSQMKQANELQETATNFTLELGALNVIYVPYKMIQVAWGAVKTMFSSVSVLTSMVGVMGTELTTTLGIPAFVFPVIITLIILTIVTILVYALFKWEFRS